MALNLKDNRGTICDPITFNNADNLNANFIASNLREMGASMGVPMNVDTSTIKEGGLFGKTYEAVVIKHPNPPQEYFYDVIVINGSTLNFFFFGYSKANYQTNKANRREGSLGGFILNRISGSSEMALQEEMLWHKKVIDAFEALVIQ